MDLIWILTNIWILSEKEAIRVELQSEDDPFWPRMKLDLFALDHLVISDPIDRLTKLIILINQLFQTFTIVYGSSFPRFNWN